LAWTSISWVGLLTLAYLIGCFPSAYLLGRFLKGVDIRELGDGNSGAANAFKVLGPPAGITAGALDAGKGTLAVMLARTLIGGEGIEMLAGMAAVAGHNWPIFLHFRGGRGASSALGVLATLTPRATLPLALGSLVPLFITKSSTVAIAFIFVPLALVSWLLGYSYTHVGYAVGLPVMVGISHYISVQWEAQRHRKVSSAEVQQPATEAIFNDPSG